MKTITLSLSFLLFFYCISPAKAQYQSIFGQNSTEWVFEWGNLFGGYQDTIYILQDTFFYGKWWKEIACTPAPWGTVFYPGGFLSEDTITGEVWYKSKWDYSDIWTDTTIQLAFNFSLDIGDTFDIHSVWGQIPDSLKIVDSIYFENGKRCIQFKKYIVSGERFTFIEGVGSNLGIIYKQLRGIMQSHYLLCAYKDTTQTYLNKYYGYCDVLPDDPSLVDKIPETTIKVYPNPVLTLLKIEKESSMNINIIQVYNSMGQRIKELPFAATMDLSELPSGFYHLVLLDKQRIIFKQSIIKL